MTNIENVYCLTLMRRKFYELIQPTTPDNHLSKVAVKEIAEIYALENVIQENYSGNYEKIKELRLEKIKPVFENLLALIEKHKDNVLPKSQLGKAINYFLSAKDGFAKVFEDGRLELDNNASERGIKSFVIGRKNWLFTNTEKGAKISCGLYSLINTAIANGLKAEDYFASSYNFSLNIYKLLQIKRLIQVIDISLNLIITNYQNFKRLHSI